MHTFRDIGKKLNQYMTQICECRKYAIFRLYLNINPVELVYESFYGTIIIIWYPGELIEGPKFVWCAPGMPKMTNKVAKFCREWPFLPVFGLFFMWNLSKTPFYPF